MVTVVALNNRLISCFIIPKSRSTTVAVNLVGARHLDNSRELRPNELVQIYALGNRFSPRSEGGRKWTPVVT